LSSFSFSGKPEPLIASVKTIKVFSINLKSEDPSSIKIELTPNMKRMKRRMTMKALASYNETIRMVNLFLKDLRI